MVRKKPMNCFQKEEQEVFHWSLKTGPAKVWSTTLSELDTFTPCYPAKKKYSLDKNNGDYSLEETEHSGVHARRMRVDFGQG